MNSGSTKTLKCGACSKSFLLPEAYLDRQINCPYCYEELNLSAVGASQSEASASFPPPDPAPPTATNTAVDQSDLVEVYCPLCGATLQIGRDECDVMAGKNYECPECNHLFTIPHLCAQCSSINPNDASHCGQCGNAFSQRLRLRPQAVQTYAPTPAPALASNHPTSTLRIPRGSMQKYRSRDVTKDYSGLGRGAYFLLSIPAHLIFLFFEGSALMAWLSGLIVMTAVQLALAASRLKNIGMSQWLALLMLVPIANFVVGCMLLVCQPGYVEINKLDAVGKLVGWLIFTCVVIASVLIFGIAVAGY